VKLAYGGPERQRAAIFLSDLSETDIVHNGRNVWTYSSQDNSASHTVQRADNAGSADSRMPVPTIATTVSPQAAAEQALKKINPSTAVTVQTTAKVAGRPAYQLVLSPRNPNSLIGSVTIALDAATSMPLRVQIWARSAVSAPALDIAFTSLHLGTPNPSTFTFSIPHGAKLNSNPLGPAGPRIRHNVNAPSTTQVIGKDWTAVVEGKVATSDSADLSGPDLDQVAALVSQLGSPVPGGVLLHTALVSVLLTKDGRIFAGSVTPSYLEQLAAAGRSQ
jgi:outer membrane lipoprotein-sorting protein